MRSRGSITRGNCQAIIDFLASKGGQEQKVEIIADAIGLSRPDAHGALQFCLKDGTVVRVRRGYYKVESDDDRWGKFCAELLKFPHEHRILLLVKEALAPVSARFLAERLKVSLESTRGHISHLRNPRHGRIHRFGFRVDSVLAKPKDYKAGPILLARDLPSLPEDSAPFVSLGGQLPTEELLEDEELWTLDEPEDSSEPPPQESGIVHYKVEGFDFLKLNDSPEYRLTSELLAQKLGYAHRHKLEQLAQRHVNFLNDLGVVTTVVITGRVGATTRSWEVPAYNRDQVVYLILKSEQPVANRLSVDFIRAYRELEHRHVTGQGPSPVQPPNLGLTLEFQRQVGGFLEVVTNILHRFLPQ